ncbi:MAG: hypothetical protein AB202_03855 [Parcubacteria bacterium C7867-007]|nr:MAG: hypothetical protein AB202_03855 [Parcubacteria bacterium C7867-007]
MKRYKEIILFQNGSIGDFLMAVFLAEQLHTSGCTSRITILVPRTSQFLRTFIGAYPFIRVVEVSRSKPISVLALIQFLRPKTLVVLQPTPGRVPRHVKLVAWLLTRLPGSALLGFEDSDPLVKKLYTQTLVYDTNVPFLTTLHSIAMALGVEQGMALTPSIKMVPDTNILAHLDLEGKPYVFIHPRGSSEKRSFEADAALEFLNALLVQFPDLTFVISGSPAEREWVTTLIMQSVAPERCVAACGMNGTQLAALISNAQLFIGVDTGITHLACFLKVPVLAIAHKGTANWLPFYHPGAQVIYRLQEDKEVHNDRAYLNAHLAGRLKPFGNVPVRECIHAATEMIRAMNVYKI